MALDRGLCSVSRRVLRTLLRAPSAVPGKGSKHRGLTVPEQGLGSGGVVGLKATGASDTIGTITERHFTRETKYNTGWRLRREG